MKLARDGHLWWGRADQPRWPYVRPIWSRMERLPNGNVYCQFPQGGGVEYGTSNLRMQGPVELLYSLPEEPHQPTPKE